jgi:hypothetical protein
MHLRKHRILFALILVPGILSGCLRTSGELPIAGKVVDEHTNQGIPLRNLFLRAYETGDPKSPSVEAGQFSTDSLGNFAFKIRKIDGARYYSFDISGDSDYYVASHFLGLMELKLNAKFLSLPMHKLTTLKINIRRTSTKPARDSLRLIWQSDGVYGWTLSQYKIFDNEKGIKSLGQRTNNDLIFIGGRINSTITTKVFAGKKTELTWEIYRNGKRMMFVDTMTCKRDVANVANFIY